MQKKIQLLLSGIPLVDKEWGGLYRGGTYILIGSHKTGRTLLSLQYAVEAANQNELCLFFTSARPKDLLIQAASINIDLQDYIENNKIIVVRVATPADTDVENKSNDEFLGEYLKDIVTVVGQYKPSKIVFDELTPFIEFKDINLLRNIFTETCEKIEDEGITSLYVLSEPVTSGSQSIFEILVSKSTGVVYLKKQNEDIQSGEMIITPNIGHSEGQFRAGYKIKAYKGLTIDSKQTDPSFGTARNRNVA